MPSVRAPKPLTSASSKRLTSSAASSKSVPVKTAAVPKKIAQKSAPVRATQPVVLPKASSKPSVAKPSRAVSPPVSKKDQVSPVVPSRPKALGVQPSRSQVPPSPKKSGVSVSRSKASVPSLPLSDVASPLSPVARPASRLPIATTPSLSVLDEGEDIGADLGSLSPAEVFDEADHAQWLNLRELADIQRRARTLNKPESHPDFNGQDCVTCGDEIPPARLQLHRVRCVDCQTQIEAANNRRQGIAV